MDRLIFLQFLAIYFINTVVEANKSGDYCWRDYEHGIPSDALVLKTKHKNTKPVYIGQTIAENKLVPVKILKNGNDIYFESHHAKDLSVQAVKVLCSKNPEKFTWVVTRHVDVLRLDNKVLIEGGFQKDCKAYIGRVRVFEDIQPGTVLCCKAAKHCYGLYTTSGALHFDFEILTYNQGADNTELDVDTRINVPQKTNEGCKKTVVINLFY